MDGPSTRPPRSQAVRTRCGRPCSPAHRLFPVSGGPPAPPAEALVPWDWAVLARGQEPAFQTRWDSRWRPVSGCGRPTATATAPAWPPKGITGRRVLQKSRVWQRKRPCRSGRTSLALCPARPPRPAMGGESGKVPDTWVGSPSPQAPRCSQGPSVLSGPRAACPGPEQNPTRRRPASCRESISVTSSCPRRLGGRVEAPRDQHRNGEQKHTEGKHRHVHAAAHVPRLWLAACPHRGHRSAEGLKDRNCKQQTSRRPHAEVPAAVTLGDRCCFLTRKSRFHHFQRFH